MLLSVFKNIPKTEKLSGPLRVHYKYVSLNLTRMQKEQNKKDKSPHTLLCKTEGFPLTNFV